MLVFLLFRINLIQLIKNKASLSKHFHLQPSEIDRMQYWEYEAFMKEVNEMITEENKQTEDQMKAVDYNNFGKGFDLNKNFGDLNKNFGDFNKNFGKRFDKEIERN